MTSFSLKILNVNKSFKFSKIIFFPPLSPLKFNNFCLYLLVKIVGFNKISLLLTHPKFFLLFTN